MLCTTITAGPRPTNMLPAGVLYRRSGPSVPGRSPCRLQSLTRFDVTHSPLVRVFPDQSRADPTIVTIAQRLTAPPGTVVDFEPHPIFRTILSDHWLFAVTTLAIACLGFPMFPTLSNSGAGRTSTNDRPLQKKPESKGLGRRLLTSMADGSVSKKGCMSQTVRLVAA
jgi:hypothetical protein